MHQLCRQIAKGMIPPIRKSTSSFAEPAWLLMLIDLKQAPPGRKNEDPR